MDLIEKEVYFDRYCSSCEHETTAEDQEPCHWCLQESWNAYSHKPVYWEAKKELK